MPLLVQHLDLQSTQRLTPAWQEQPACEVKWRVQLQHLLSTALAGHLGPRFGGMSVAVVSYVRFRKKPLSLEMASRRWGPGALYVGLCGTDEPLTWSCLSVCL